MIEAAHLTRQETKELCQQEVQRYIHVHLCTKTYFFLYSTLIFSFILEKNSFALVIDDICKIILYVFQT